MQNWHAPLKNDFYTLPVAADVTLKSPFYPYSECNRIQTMEKHQEERK